MSIIKWRAAVTGYLLISVRGAAAEKLINLAIRQGIPLWDIRSGKDSALLKTDIDSFFDLRHLAKKTGCRLKIVRKAGLPFVYSRLFRRRGLLYGICFFIITLYVLSSFVLFVGVEGNKHLDDAYVRELAARSGVRPGVLKSNLDKEKIVKQLITLEPGLAWAGVHIRGTRVVIEVVENIKPPVGRDRPTNLIAAKDGLITDVLVIMGEAKVKPGDTVTRGQILIEGVLRPQPLHPTESGENQGPQPVPVHARGEVKARVWYEGYGEAALTEVTRIRTGRRSQAWTLAVDGQAVLRVGRFAVPYRNYDVETANAGFSERIIRFPVEIIIETSYEVDLLERKLTHEQALEIAAGRARTLAELQLPVGVLVEKITVDELTLEREGFVGVRYIVETVENIAEEELVNGGDSAS